MALENISVEKFIPLMSAAFGAILTLIFSNFTWERTWKKQKKYEQTNIAYAMYQELSLRNELLSVVISQVKLLLTINTDAVSKNVPNPNPNPNPYLNTFDPKYSYFDTKYSYNDTFIYTEKDLYFIFRKEILGFDKKLFDSIVQLYTSFEVAENQRIFIKNMYKDSCTFKNPPMIKSMYQPLLDKLLIAQTELQKTQKLLIEKYKITVQSTN